MSSSDFEVEFQNGKGRLRRENSGNFDHPLDPLVGVSSGEDDVFSMETRVTVDKKPLMAPRLRTRSRISVQRAKHKLKSSIWPIIYVFVFIGYLIAFVCLIVYLVNAFTANLSKTQHSANLVNILLNDTEYSNLIGCSNIEVEDVWIAQLPKLTTEAAIRLVDVNQDGVLDVITGFGTGVDGVIADPLLCKIYFNGSFPCQGGLLALDGLTGRELWRHYSIHEMFAVNCNYDMNKDGVLDCLGSGRAGVLQLVNGKDGALIWNFGSESDAHSDIMNVYTAQFVQDLDDDGFPDVLAAHGGDPLREPGSKVKLFGRLILFSGVDGRVLMWRNIPADAESYYSPQLFTLTDGTEVILFGTGGETSGGGLFYISLSDLYNGRMDKAREIYRDPKKGIMTPPVLIDMTKDGVEDIVMSAFNSTVFLADGLTHKIIWNFTYPGSESYSTPAVGYFNNDDVPDFLIKYSYGPGFPIYYHSVTTVLDGKTGRPLLEPYVRDTVGAQTSSLTISVEGRGNDMFLYWVSDCLQHEGEGGEYTFRNGTNVHEKSRSDFCKLRFKSSGFTKMYALNQHVEAPGETVYYSVERNHTEVEAWVNTTKEAIDFVMTHPKYFSDFAYYRDRDAAILAGDTSAYFGKELSPENQPEVSKDLMSYYNEGQQRDPPPNHHYDNQNNYHSDQQQNNKPKLQNDFIIENKYANNRQKTKYAKDRQKPLDFDDRAGYHSNSDSNYGNSDLNTNSKTYNNIPQDILNLLPDEIDKSSYDKVRNFLADVLKSNNENNVEDTLNDEPPYHQWNEPKSQVQYNIKSRKQQGRRGNAAKRDDTLSESQSDSSSKTYKIPQMNDESHRNRRSSRTLESQDNKSLKDFINSYINKTPGQRIKRHVGVHADGGLQRLISTGTLAPSLLDPGHPDFSQTIDVVFSVFWFFPAKTVVYLPEDQKCMDDKMKDEDVRFQPESQYYGMDHDAFEHAVEHECLELSNHQLPDNGKYNSQRTYNPYNRNMGQMTVY
ncbi:unnamed protein product, partial [Owenia fusiformis]